MIASICRRICNSAALAEGHNHWLEAAAIDQYNACYLADGFYYVKDMGNLPWVMDHMTRRGK